MPPGVLFDTGTLRNFAACDALDLLRRICGEWEGPYWVEAVQAEVRRASIHKQGRERTQCRYILSTIHGAWLGEPIEPEVDGQRQIFAIRTALASGLGGHAMEHLGEAQSIWVAEQVGARFATDDGPAFDFAARRLGSARVVDTVQLLRHGVGNGALTSAEACDHAQRMRAMDRILRPGHPAPLRPSDFT